MASYFFVWAPLVVIGAMVVLLTAPFFAVLVLAFLFFTALAALAWAIVVVPYKLGLAVSHRWHNRGVASPQPAPALVRTTRQTA